MAVGVKSGRLVPARLHPKKTMENLGEKDKNSKLSSIYDYTRRKTFSVNDCIKKHDLFTLFLC